MDKENTYQITGSELIEICEAIANGYTLNSLESDNDVMSVTLTKQDNPEIIMNFLR